MEVGEHHLSLAHERILWLYWLFHLHNHVGGGIYVLYGRQDFGSRLKVFLVAESAVLSGSVLHIHSVSVFYQFGNSSRCHSDPVLVVFDFFWNTDFHNL